VEISTGRHHQIRKHLRAIGHPIIGDFRHGYNDRNLALQNDYGQTLPLCLHCHQLDFIFKNKPYTYSSPLPAAIQNLLSWLNTSQK
jgi:tRNA pseudouridine65 synthase